MERFVHLGNVITDVIDVVIQVDIIRDVGRCFTRLYIALENGIIDGHGQLSGFFGLGSRLSNTKMPKPFATLLFF